MDLPTWTGYLPPELWLVIFDHGEQKDFFQISLVCRFLHSLIERYLYQEFDWIPTPRTKLPGIIPPHDGGIADGAQEWYNFRPTPYFWLRTIIERPELAQYFKRIKILAVTQGVGLFWDEKEAKRHFPFEDEQLDPWEVMDGKPEDKEELMKKWIREGRRMEVNNCMLLKQLCNLSSVEIRARSGFTNGNLVFHSLSSLKSVKSVTVTLDMA
jgi:F-box-like